MTPANFSVRPRSRRRPVVAIVLVLAAVAVALYFIGKTTSKGNPSASPTQTPDRPVMSFTLDNFATVVEKRVKAPAGGGERRDLLAFFNDYYLKGFVDPSGWSDPSWASLAAKYSPDSRARFAKNTDVLTIGEGRNEFTRVRPDTATLRLAVYYDKDAKPAYAIATVRFLATATTRTKQTVTVDQTATYRLQRDATGWLIFSYGARESQNTTPTSSPSPDGSPT